MQRVMVAAEEAKQGARASDPDINPNRFLPAGLGSLVLKDWIMAPGLTFKSGAQKKVSYTLTLEKAPQFLRHSPKLDCWVSGKAGLFVDPKTAEVRIATSPLWYSTSMDLNNPTARPCTHPHQPCCLQVSSSASLRLKTLRYNVTSKQDLRVSVGLDLASSGSSLRQWSHAPYLKISENSLSLKLKDNSWSLLYAL